MKKFIAIMASVAILLSLTVISVSAFEVTDLLSITEASQLAEIFVSYSPVNVSVEPGTGTTMTVKHEKDAEIATGLEYWQQHKDGTLNGLIEMFLNQLLDRIAVKDMALFTQIDWALDDVNDWKYTSVWDNKGMESDVKKVGSWAYVDELLSGDSSDETVIFADSLFDTTGTDWNGASGIAGMKDMLKEGQYTVNGNVASIDYEGHTLYVRVRYGVELFYTDKDTTDYYFSAWSDAAQYSEGTTESSEDTSEDVSEDPVSSEPSEEDPGDSSLEDSEASEISEDTVLYGDANDDMSVDMKDVLAIRKNLAGLGVEINEVQADANVDGTVDMKDVLMIRKYLADLIASLGSAA